MLSQATLCQARTEELTSSTSNRSSPLFIPGYTSFQINPNNTRSAIAFANVAAAGVCRNVPITSKFF